MRDYQLISPSLEGILSHSSVVYEGVNRPVEIMRVLDGPATKGLGKKGKGCSEEERKILEQYFQDLYGVFLKKFSVFALESQFISEETLKLQAMLQEMVNVKRLLAKEKEIEV
ncbi:MAG: hypothetical protein V4481_02515 [Patescibacteria group bacterium]